jgi:hypothetical protein
MNMLGICQHDIASWIQVSRKMLQNMCKISSSSRKPVIIVQFIDNSKCKHRWTLGLYRITFDKAHKSVGLLLESCLWHFNLLFKLPATLSAKIKVASMQNLRQSLLWGVGLPLEQSHMVHALQ